MSLTFSLDTPHPPPPLFHRAAGSSSEINDSLQVYFHPATMFHRPAGLISHSHNMTGAPSFHTVSSWTAAQCKASSGPLPWHFSIDCRRSQTRNEAHLLKAPQAQTDRLASAPTAPRPAKGVDRRVAPSTRKSNGDAVQGRTLCIDAKLYPSAAALWLLKAGRLSKSPVSTKQAAGFSARRVVETAPAARERTQ